MLGLSAYTKRVHHAIFKPIRFLQLSNANFAKRIGTKN